MIRDCELDRLKSKEQLLFQAKQNTWTKWRDAWERVNEAHNLTQEAWQSRCLAKEIMNREFEVMRSNSEYCQRVWDEYGRIRDCNNSRIESLKSEADYEHRQMCNCFDQASSAYNYGDKSMAPIYSQEGREHQNRRDRINAEISGLAREVKKARQNAECKAPKTDSSAFRSAQDAFNCAKEYHQRLDSEFKRLKAERDRLKVEFDRLQEDHKCAKAAFQRRLEELKSANQREREGTLDKAGVRWLEREDAKIIKKADGTTQIYHGGLGSGDGIGHGHTSLDQDGQVTYSRNAFEKHGSHNYADNKGFTIYNRSARKNTPIGGSGEENYINVRTGRGHTTQWYDDGYRISWDTEDGGKTEKAHWTNQNVSKRNPHRHDEPDDANID